MARPRHGPVLLPRAHVHPCFKTTVRKPGGAATVVVHTWAAAAPSYAVPVLHEIWYPYGEINADLVPLCAARIRLRGMGKIVTSTVTFFFKTPKINLGGIFSGRTQSGQQARYNVLQPQHPRQERPVRPRLAGGDLGEEGDAVHDLRHGHRDCRRVHREPGGAARAAPVGEPPRRRRPHLRAQGAGRRPRPWAADLGARRATEAARRSPTS